MTCKCTVPVKIVTGNRIIESVREVVYDTSSTDEIILADDFEVEYQIGYNVAYLKSS